LTDGAARVIRVTDPSGRSTSAADDAPHLMMINIDAWGTQPPPYDANGNLLTLSGARNDDLGLPQPRRVATRTDSLTRGERFDYDMHRDPDYTAQPAGTRMDFWHYDPTAT
jgi:hypothetical protein